MQIITQYTYCKIFNEDCKLFFFFFFLLIGRALSYLKLSNLNKEKTKLERKQINMSYHQSKGRNRDLYSLLYN